MVEGIEVYAEIVREVHGRTVVDEEVLAWITSERVHRVRLG